MNDRDISQEEELLLRASIARMRAGIMAIVIGAVAGGGLFLATVWLLLRGGPLVGPHLGLLANYFPGYSVTWTGAFVGLGYGVAGGAIVGWILARVYNLVAERRDTGD